MKKNEQQPWHEWWLQQSQVFNETAQQYLHTLWQNENYKQPKMFEASIQEWIKAFQWEWFKTAGQQDYLQQMQQQMSESQQQQRSEVER